MTIYMISRGGSQPQISWFYRPYNEKYRSKFSFFVKKKNTNIKILPGFGLLKWEVTILTNKFFKPLRRFPCPNPGGVLKFGFGRDVPPRNLKIDPYKYQFFKKK